jgi:hypothetical protein
VPHHHSLCVYACRGEIVYPNPSAQYSSHAYQCKPAACNYGCNFFNVSVDDSVQHGLCMKHPAWACQPMPLAKTVTVSMHCLQHGGQLTCHCKPRCCSHAACVCTQESQPAFTIQKEPGRHYIMLLDRGPRKQPHQDHTSGLGKAAVVDGQQELEQLGSHASTLAQGWDAAVFRVWQTHIAKPPLNAWRQPPQLPDPARCALQTCKGCARKLAHDAPTVIPLCR